MKLIPLLLLSLVLASCGAGLRSEAKPSGSPNDTLYKEQRSKRADYAESASINVCSDDSAKCYTLVGEVNHHFDEHGNESTTVETVHFENGGYLTFGGASIPGSGVDQRGKSWSLSW